MPDRARVSLPPLMFLACLMLACLMPGCGNPTVDCEVFVNDALLVDGIVNFTPHELERDSVLAKVKNGKVVLVDNVRLQPGKCKVVLTTTKKAIQGDESFTPTFKASAGETVVLEDQAFDVPEGGFELRFTSGVKPQ